MNFDFIEIFDTLFV